MAIEIERKFLLRNNDWQALEHTSAYYQQAYFCNTAKVSVRIRMSNAKAWVSFKSTTLEISRFEYEYEVPLNEAKQMMDEFSEGSIISKTRYFVPVESHIWEIDVFEGDNQGLVVAEIELQHTDEDFFKPAWIGEEVSKDMRYFNSNLVTYPFKDW